MRSIHRDFPNAGVQFGGGGSKGPIAACTAQYKCVPADSPRMHAKNGSGGGCNEMAQYPLLQELCTALVAHLHYGT